MDNPDVLDNPDILDKSDISDKSDNPDISDKIKAAALPFRVSRPAGENDSILLSFFALAACRTPGKNSAAQLGV